MGPPGKWEDMQVAGTLATVSLGLKVEKAFQYPAWTGALESKSSFINPSSGLQLTLAGSCC